MHKYLVTTLVLAAAALAASAAPAFTADSGSVTVNVTAQAPAAPCLTVTPETVDFGTLPFSTPSGAPFTTKNITLTSCGSAGENLLGSATNANGPSGTWVLVNPVLSGGVGPICPTTDTFYMDIFTFAFLDLFLSGTPAPVLASDGGPPAVLSPGTAYPSQLNLAMPCQGSNGAGESKTFTVTFMAVVA